VILNWLGATVAIYMGASFNLTLFLLGQLVITATQLMTHYGNEYFDLEADRANATPTNWSGGSRILVEHDLSPKIALYIACASAGIALLGTIVIVHVMGAFQWVIVGLILTAIALSWFYSAPPLRLHSSGLGELSATLTVAALTPMTAYYLQAHTIDMLILLAVVPLCTLQCAMLVSIEFPDESGDRVVGKKTLVVRLGARRGAIIYSGLLISTYVSLPLIVISGFPLEVALLMVLPLPLALWLLWKIWRGDYQQPTKWNSLGFYSIVLLMSTIAFEWVGFVLLIGFQ